MTKLITIPDEVLKDLKTLMSTADSPNLTQYIQDILIDHVQKNKTFLDKVKLAKGE